MPDSSYQTRRTITLVCREWLAIGRQFIYEDLVLKKPRGEDPIAELAQLLLVLERNDGGRFVNRISIQSDVWFKSEEFILVRRLLSICPNTRSIHLACLAVNKSQISSLLASQSLRRIFMDDVSYPIFQAVDPQNRLAELYWLGLNANSFKPSTIPIQMSLNNLTVLEIFLTNSVSHLSSLVLPALRYLSLLEVEEEHIPLLLPFMETNGPRLLGLAILSQRVCYDLNEIFEHCTALEGVVMDDMDCEDFLAGSSTCPSVTHIGIRSFNSGRLPYPHRIQRGFHQIHSCFSGLRVIRILAADDIPPDSRDDWGKLAGKLALKQVRMEDNSRRHI